VTNPQSWASAADPTRRVGRAVEFHARIGSTNDRARELLAGTDGEGVAVVADLQTAGRGRRGRSWASPAGANLLVSVGIRPRLDADRLPLLGLAAARAVLIACRQAAPGVALAVRWPNDVVSAEGRKLAGVLAEAASEAGQPPEVILGMGINTNWQRAEMPDEIAVSATSLREVTAAAVNRVALLGDLLEALDRGVAELEAGGSPVPALRADAWLDGKLVEVEVGERRVRGTVTGLRDDGALLLLTDDGPVALQVGEVVRVASAGSAGVAA